MTAEQLEEMLHRAESHDAGWYSAQSELILLAPSLARRVIAAEKLVAELELILENDDDHWSMFKCALTAYREASK
jgi:hypothetical protein